MTTRRPKKRVRSRTLHHGFTLIELAVAMFVIALLLGSILVPLATQVEQRQISETQKRLDDIREALIGHALANGYLPCPDALPAPPLPLRPFPTVSTPVSEINNGAEDVNNATGECETRNGTISIGNLPWATLGLGSADAWGNRFRYVVVSEFAQRPVPPTSTPPTFITTTGTPATFLLCENAGCAPPSAELSRVSVAIVISHGGNGQGAMNATTNSFILNPGGFPPDEFANADIGPNKVSRTKSTQVGNEFDDIVISLSRFTLINRMVAAGRLP